MSAEGPKTAEPSARVVRVAFEEPWRVADTADRKLLVTRTSRIVASASAPEEARRIVACVNAMIGISTEALEMLPGDLDTFVAALKAGRNGGREGTH
jgi:hypothetical protein